MKTKNRKSLSKLISAVCLSVLVVSSFALFTDRAQSSDSHEIGTMDLVFTDISSSKTGANGITSNHEGAVDKTWEKGSLLSSGQVSAPGDYFDMSYQLSNDGSLAMDVKQRLTITSDVPMTEGSEEYYLVAGDEHWFYNGVELPKLPDDLSSYPYNYISYYVEGYYLLTHVNKPAEYFKDNAVGELAVIYSNNTSYKQYIYIPSEMNEWILDYEYDGDLEMFLHLDEVISLIWSNTAVSSEDGSFTFMEGSAPVVQYDIEGTLSNGNKTLTYDLTDITLNGSDETVEDIENTSHDQILRFDFSKYAGNTFQGNNVTVKLEVMAKQHKNSSDADWVTWDTYETVFEKVN